MKPLTILLTGTGAPGTPGTVYSLRNNPDGREVRIIGVDADAGCLNQHLVDEFYEVEHVESNGYEPHMVPLFHRADVVLLQTTAESEYWAALPHDEFPAVVCNVIGPTLSKVYNKWWLYQATEHMYVPRPNTMLCGDHVDVARAAEALRYLPNNPIIAKPPNSNGSRGVVLLTPEPDYTGKPGIAQTTLIDFRNAMLYRRAPSPALIQQYLPGPEYTVDCFRGEGGFIAVPRLRAKTRGGITTRAETIIHTDKGRQLAEWCRIMSDAFDLRYAHGYQWKESAKGTPRLLECNARIQGTMATSTHAGFNMIWASVKEALGEPVAVPAMEELTDVVYERVWDGVATKRKEVLA